MAGAQKPIPRTVGTPTAPKPGTGGRRKHAVAATSASGSAVAQMDVDKPPIVASKGKGVSKASAIPEKMDVDKGENSEPADRPQQISQGFRGGGLVRRHPNAGESPPKAYACIRAMQNLPAMETDPADVPVERKLLERVRVSKWRVQEFYGVPVCRTSVREAKSPPPLPDPDETASEKEERLEEEKEDAEEDKACTHCESYLQHLSAAVLADDGGLEAAINLRNFWHDQTSKASMVARLQGELRATKAVMEKESDRANRLQTEMIDLAAHKLTNDRELDNCQIRLGKLRNEHDAALDELARLRDALNRDTKDDSRKRKRSDNVGAGAGLRRSDDNRVSDSLFIYGNVEFTEGNVPLVRSEYPSPDCSLVVKDGKLNTAIDFLKLVGIPRSIILELHCSSLPPAAGSWPVDRGTFMPTTIAGWSDAYQFSLDRDCWIVAFGVFLVYYIARRIEARNGQLTELQKFALANYRLPCWFFAMCQRLVVNANDWTYNKAFWSKMPQPDYRAPETAAAAHIQHWGHKIPGCPFMDDYDTLDLRLVKGVILWRAITPLPCAENHATRTARAKIMHALLSVLAPPGAYQWDLKQNPDIQVAQKRQLVHWELADSDDLTDKVVVTKLASMGFTPEDADEMYAFICNLLDDLRDTPHDGWDPDELDHLIEASRLKDGQVAPGRPFSKELLFSRPPGLLHALKQTNDALEKAASLEDMFLALPPGTNMSGRVNGTPGSSINASSSRGYSSRGRGGNLNRGRGAHRGEYAARGGFRGGHPRQTQTSGFSQGATNAAAGCVQDAEMPLVQPAAAAATDTIPHPTAHTSTITAPQFMFNPAANNTMAAPFVFGAAPPPTAFQQPSAMPAQAMFTPTIPWGYNPMLAQQQYVQQQQFQQQQQLQQLQFQSAQHQSVPQQQQHSGQSHAAPMSQQQTQPAQQPQQFSGLSSSIHAPNFISFHDLQQLSAPSGSASINAPDNTLHFDENAQLTAGIRQLDFGTQPEGN
ncbi:hypothetical protein C8R43DRAFT_963864 [Mycena crocata]|nr:hypothetical protein C8R43DRAFT_963864 [Mycena crocata]